MSGAEVLGIISAIVAIVDATIKLSEAIKDEAGLPPNFKSAATKLPLVAKLLQDAEEYVEGSADQAVVSTFTPVLLGCKKKTMQLQQLFAKVIPEEGDSRFDSYLKAARTIGKGGRVETLMTGVLADIQLLATRFPKTLSQKDHQSLTRAIDEVSKLQPSIPYGMRHMSSIACDGGVESDVQYLITHRTENRQSNETTPTHHFMVPFGRNREFVGRESTLERLLETAPPRAEQDDCQRIAIEGLGGVGKTQIALELVFRIRDMDPECSIFWVPATDATSFEMAYRKIGQLLHIRGIDEDNADVGLLVKNALSESSYDWLLIIDNADDAEVVLSNSVSSPIAKYLPFSRRGSLLFTTRSHQISIDLDICARNSHMVPEMSRLESISMLKQNVKSSQTQSTENLNALLDFLADLPLAIKQASAYMSKTGISVAKYLSYCRSSDKKLIKLLSKGFEDRGRYDSVANPVAATWLISFDHISRDNTLAVECLRFMCFLAEKSIPSSLLPREDDEDEMELDEAIGVLRAYSFITECAEPNTFDMHRLVRLAIRNWLENEGRAIEYWAVVLRRLAAVFPLPTRKNKAIWLGYLPHSQAAVEFGPDIEARRSNGHLLYHVGLALELLGKYKHAEVAYQASLGLRKEAVGPKHQDTASSMNSLANVLVMQGKPGEAKQLYQDALRLRQDVLGGEHRDTLNSMSNLALVLTNEDIEAAERLHRQVLELRLKLLGDEDPDSLASMTNLGLLLSKKERYEEAEEMHEKSLSLMQKVNGIEHPHTLTGLNNLATVLQLQGRHEEACEKYQMVLTLRQHVLGDEHPDTLASMYNLGLVLISRGSYNDAEQLLRQALRSRENVLGKEHPDTVVSENALNNLVFSLKTTTDGPRSYDFPPTELNISESESSIRESTHGYRIGTKHQSDRQLSMTHSQSDILTYRSLSERPTIADQSNIARRSPSSPPSRSQSFGPGARSGYSYQYSSCKGRRRALLIGINYFGQPGQLRGCINDVRNMASFLAKDPASNWEDMIILTDDHRSLETLPTKKNILRAMHWLVENARPNDSLFFHYSGHGGQTKSLDGDEVDGYDEVIYPVDFRERGHITDDEMHRIMVQPLPAGVRLTAIFDSCHSGTAMSLPYIYSTQGILKEPNLAKEAGQGLLPVLSSYSQGDLGNLMNSITTFFKKITSDEEAFVTKTSPADVIILSSSKDDQTSYAYLQNTSSCFNYTNNFLEQILPLRRKPQEQCRGPLLMRSKKPPSKATCSSLIARVTSWRLGTGSSLIGPAPTH